MNTGGSGRTPGHKAHPQAPARAGQTRAHTPGPAPPPGPNVTQPKKPAGLLKTPAPPARPTRPTQPTRQAPGPQPRSEERRVGEECRIRWPAYHYINTTT